MSSSFAMRALLGTAAAIGLMACRVGYPAPELLEETRPQRLPLRMGVHIPAQLRDYIYGQSVTETPFVLGEPSARLLPVELALWFDEIALVPRPGPGAELPPELAGVVTLSIHSAGYELEGWPFSGLNQRYRGRQVVVATRVTYGLELHAFDGRQVASVEATGWGEEPLDDLSRIVEGMERSFEQAMQRAAWELGFEFHRSLEVRRWLAEQRDRPGARRVGDAVTR